MTKLNELFANLIVDIKFKKEAIAYCLFLEQFGFDTKKYEHIIETAIAVTLLQWKAVEKTYVLDQRVFLN